MNNRLNISCSHPEAANAIDWLSRYRESIECTVERIPFAESEQWAFDADRAVLKHKSGRFFSVRGYRYSQPGGAETFQPLIYQPETGTQGFVIRRHGWQIELLTQARTEPGNVGLVQIGPTIQATYSNYTAAHNGRRQPFLTLFHHPERFGFRPVLDTVQPELGTRFLKKWNRNIVVECPDSWGYSHPMFHWVPLDAFAELMQFDHIVNNDARLVFGLLTLDQAMEQVALRGRSQGDAVLNSIECQAGTSFNSVADAESWLNGIRRHTQSVVEECPLQTLPEWQIASDEIRHEARHYFSVIQTRVHAADREVCDWDQPLLATGHTADVTLVCREDNGVLNLLFHATDQIGNANGAELQPTCCFDKGDGESAAEALQPLLVDDAIVRRFSCEGSDEGGRFYQCLSRFDVRWIASTVNVELPPEYCWLTLGQVRSLLSGTDYVSDEARSVLSIFMAAALSNAWEQPFIRSRLAS